MDYINKRFNNLNRYTKIPIIFQASDYIRYQEWLLIQSTSSNVQYIIWQFKCDPKSWSSERFEPETFYLLTQINPTSYQQFIKQMWAQREERAEGSGCGSVGWAVASTSRGPQFESSHWHNLYGTFTVSCIEKTKRKKKEAENGPL